MSVTKKPGRPRNGEEREELTVVSFKVDAEVRAALEAIAPPEGQSTILRRLILEEAARLVTSPIKTPRARSTRK